MEMSLAGLWTHMGLFARLIVMLLGLMSALTVLVVVERIVYFVTSTRASRAFAAAVAEPLSRCELTAASEAQSDTNVGYLGRVIGAGLQASRRRFSSVDMMVESVGRALEKQAQRESQNLKRGLGLVATIGSTAPFVGLLGTVVGIVNSFREMAVTGSGGLGTVSGGIAEALVTTAVGLLAAIPAVMAYNFLQSWADARAVDIAEASNEFLDAVMRGSVENTGIAKGPTQSQNPHTRTQTLTTTQSPTQVTSSAVKVPIPKT